MKKTIKFLSVMLAAVMLLTVIPVFALAEEPVTSGKCGENLTWEFEDRTLTISGSGAMENYYAGSVSPWNGLKESISKVECTSGVTSIGYGAFSGCTSLASVRIPDSVTSIGGKAFSGCSFMTLIIIPDSVTSIGSEAFAGCTWLGSTAIPDSVTSIGDGVFSGCSSLVLVTLPSGMEKLPNRMFEGCSSLRSLTIPQTVTQIGTRAFRNCTSLTSVSLPDGITIIDGQAFSGCTSLSSVPLPDGLQTIGSEAFSGCIQLKSITIPVSVKRIELHSAFNGCPELTIYGYPDTCAEECALRNNIPFVPLGEAPQYDHPSGSCGDNIIWSFEDGVLRLSGTGSTCDNLIGDRWYCSRWGLTPEDIITIEVENGITEIAEDTFRGCSAVETIVLPETITKIDCRAFVGCDSLSSLIIPGKTLPRFTYSFVGAANYIRSFSDLTIYAHAGSVSLDWSPEDFAENEGIRFVALPETDVPEESTEPEIPEEPTEPEIPEEPTEPEIPEEPTEPEIPEEPDKPQTFIERIMAFFDKIFDWLRNLFR